MATILTMRVSLAKVRIFVMDVNDNSPMLEEEDNNNEIYIRENNTKVRIEATARMDTCCIACQT